MPRLSELEKALRADEKHLGELHGLRESAASLYAHWTVDTRTSAGALWALIRHGGPVPSERALARAVVEEARRQVQRGIRTLPMPEGSLRKPLPSWTQKAA